MTGVAIKARRTSTATPLEFSLTGNGPVTGATVVVAVRDGQSSVALPSYLDFDDDEFKTAGWTTRQAALTELGGGFYARALDINAITNLPAATVVLMAEYEVTAPANVTGVGGPDSIILDEFSSDVAAAVWDEILTGATHNIATSAGRRLRELAEFGQLTSGLAQAGAATTITLAAGESAIDDFFNFALIGINGGTGENQIRIIVDYDGTTKIATLDRAWLVNPNATSEYVIGLNAAAVVTADTLNVIRDAIVNDATRFPGASITEARLAELDAGNIPTDLANIQADTDDIQARLPASLTGGGRMRSHVEAFDAAVIDAAAIATDAIDADALAADAVAEIQSGLATAASIVALPLAVWDFNLDGTYDGLTDRDQAGGKMRWMGILAINPSRTDIGTQQIQIRNVADTTTISSASITDSNGNPVVAFVGAVARRTTAFS